MYTETFARPYPSYRCNYISNITLVKYNIGRNFDRISIINMKKIGVPITEFWHRLNDVFIFFCA